MPFLIYANINMVTHNTYWWSSMLSLVDTFNMSHLSLPPYSRIPLHPYNITTQMNMTHLSQPQPNLSSIGEGCNSVRTDWLSSFAGNHWASGGLQLKLTP